MSFGVVGDGGDGMQAGAGGVEQRGRCGGLLRPDVDLAELAALVVAGLDDVGEHRGAVRGDLLDRTAERVVRRNACEPVPAAVPRRHQAGRLRRGVELGGGRQAGQRRPVDRGMVVRGELPDRGHGVALEVEGAGLGVPGLGVAAEEAAAQVGGLLAFAVDVQVKEDLGGAAGGHVAVRRPSRRVVDQPERVPPVVPGADHLPGHAGQRPPRAAVRAHAVDGPARHVGARDVADAAVLCRLPQDVLLRAPAELVENRQGLALGVAGGADRVAGRRAVVRDRQACPAERVEVDGGGGGGERGSLARRVLLRGLLFGRGAVLAAAAQVIPGRERRAGEQPGEVVSDVRVGARVGGSRGIVAVPRLLPPRAERGFLPRAVGMEHGHDAARWVVAGDRGDTDRGGELEVGRGREERLVGADRPSLVVVDRPARCGPPRRPGVRVRRRQGLTLDLPPEPVVVGQAVLAASDLRGPRVRRRPPRSETWVSRAIVKTAGGDGCAAALVRW